MAKISRPTHKELQRAVLEQFAPRFAPGSAVLHLGSIDAEEPRPGKALVELLHIPKRKAVELPDVMLHQRSRNRLFLIELATRLGHISAERKLEFERSLRRCPIARVYVSAFPNFGSYKADDTDAAWGSAVWIAEEPGHLIHFSGDNAMAPSV